MNLETPESALRELIVAYEDRDFLRVYVMLDFDTQIRAFRAFRAMNNGDLRWFRREIYAAPEFFSSEEHHPWFGVVMIGRVLNDAAATESLHVDLAGAEIDHSAIERSDDSGTVAVTLKTGEQAKILLSQSPAGRWRVRQIAIDGVEFDDSEHLVVDSTCGEMRVRVYEGVECPSADWGELSEDQQAEVDRLRQEALEDSAKVVTNLPLIQAIVSNAPSLSDEQICAAMQFNAAANAEAAIGERAAVLVETTCPGDLDVFQSGTPLSEPADEVGDRTRYAQLDLSTPEAGLNAAQALFANEAFIMLFHALDADAQDVLARHSNNLDLEKLAEPGLIEQWSGIAVAGVDEHPSFMVFVFDQFMTLASDNDLHYFDLTRSVSIVGTSPTAWTNSDGDVLEAQVVEFTLDDTGETVFALMLESASGRWRIRQLATDPAEFADPENLRRVFIR